jgi:tRNA(Ile)-lysidine synthase
MLIEIRKYTSFKLLLMHFNHNVLNQAKDMEQFCRGFAKSNNIQFCIRNLVFIDGINFESSARVERYKGLNRMAKKLNYDIILTAHHIDDQIETLYMKKIDGADWISNIGIRESIGKIKRPMLEVNKNMIMDYAKNRNLLWIEDPSNNDVSFRRNYIRKIELPKLFKKNPNLGENLLLEAEFNRKKMDSILNNYNMNKKLLIYKNSETFIKINLESILKLSLEELKLFVYWSLQYAFEMNISSKSRHYWNEFYNYICTAKTGAKFIIADKVCYLNRSQMTLTIASLDIISKEKKTRLVYNKIWYDTIFNIKKTNCFDMSQSKEYFIISDDIYSKGLYLRQWKVGDKILVSTSKKHSLVSDLFINNKVSRFDKLIHPIVVDSTERIVWIPRIAHSYIEKQKLSDKLKRIEWIQS